MEPKLSSGHPILDRYGDETISALFSEKNIRRLWRKVWLALAAAQSPDIVPVKMLNTIAGLSRYVDIPSSRSAESLTQHELVSELMVYRGQCGPDAAEYLHLGATSSDITENALHLVQKESLLRIITLLGETGDQLSHLSVKCEDLPCAGRTHLKIADPTSYGHRFRYYYHELSLCLDSLNEAYAKAAAKGFKGTVGNRYSYAQVYLRYGAAPNLTDALRKARSMDLRACDILTIDAPYASLQTPNRQWELSLMAALCNLGAAMSKLSTDLRLLIGIGEISINRDKKYVGSSSMPWKNNPIEFEKVCSLARMLPGLYQTLWANASSSWLERSLDDSANSRIIWVDAFTIVAHILITLTRTLPLLNFDRETIEHNFAVSSGESDKKWEP